MTQQEQSRAPDPKKPTRRNLSDLSDDELAKTPGWWVIRFDKPKTERPKRAT